MISPKAHFYVLQTLGSKPGRPEADNSAEEAPKGNGLPQTYLWLVGNGGMVVIVVIIVPHSSIPY